MSTEPKLCECCDADGPLYLHGKCHPRSRTWAVMHRRRLVIECAECGKAVAEFLLTETGWKIQ